MASSREQSKTAYDLLTQYRLAIFGLAALWIYCRHTIHNYDYTYLQPFQSVFNIGDAGVDVFLFLSGFGLYFSLQKNSSALVFYKKRLLRILPSFLLFSIVLCFERGTFQRVGWNPLLCLKSLFSGWWYVVFILFAYAFTPPILKIFNNNISKLGVLIVTGMSLLALIGIYFGPNTGVLCVHVARIPIFICGMFYASHLEYLDNRRLSWMLLLFGIIAMLVIPFEYKIYRRLFYMPLAVGAVTLLPHLLCKLPNWLCCSLSVIGYASFEFYLIHIALLLDVAPYLMRRGLSLTLVFLITLIAAICISLLYKYIIDLIVTKFK